MKAPRAGERRVLVSRFGRCLYEQSFYYPKDDGGEREEIFSLWGYQKGLPCIVFPVTTDQKVVVVEQYRHGSNQFHLELPGGLPKGDQDPVEVVRNELLEETGYEAGKLIDLGSEIWFDAAAHDLRYRPFVALDCVKVADPSLGKNEVMETTLIPIPAWYKMIYQGRVVDNKVLSLSLLAQPHIGIQLNF